MGKPILVHSLIKYNIFFFKLQSPFLRGVIKDRNEKLDFRLDFRLDKLCLNRLDSFS